MLTRTGKRTLAAAVVLYFAAWGFGTDVMFPIAVGLMIAPLVALVWVRTFTRPVRMRRTLTQHELVEGATVVIGLEVRPEAGPLPAKATLIDHLGEDMELTADLVRVGHRLRGKPPACRSSAGSLSAASRRTGALRSVRAGPFGDPR